MTADRATSLVVTTIIIYASCELAYWRRRRKQEF